MNRVKIGEVCEIINGFAFPSESFSSTRGTPLIRIRDLKTNAPVTFFDGTFDSAYVVIPGDLLIGMDGEFHAYRWAGSKSLLNQRVCKLVPATSRLDPQYLYYAIQKPLNDIEATTAFTTVKHISSKDIKLIEFELPSLEEQRRIVEGLGRQISGISGVKQSLASQSRLLPSLKLSTIDEEFSRFYPKTKRVPLNELAIIIRGVVYSGSEARRTSVDGLLPILRAGNIQGRLILDEDLVWVPKGYVKSSQMLQSGDIAICLASGSASLVGKTARLEREFTGSVGGFCAIIRPRTQNLSAAMSHWFRSSEYESWRCAQAQGSNIQNLKTSELAKVLVPEMRKDDADAIADRLDYKLGQCQIAEVAIARQTQLIQNLGSAVLRRAFSGEL